MYQQEIAALKQKLEERKTPESNEALGSHTARLLSKKDSSQKTPNQGK